MNFVKLRKILKVYKIRTFYWELMNFIWLKIRISNREIKPNSVFSFGIVTYVDRYELFFVTFIKSLVFLFPNIEIVVAVNGYHNQVIQNEYLAKIKTYTSNFKNVKLLIYSKPESLSKLWNQIIINSKSNKIFIFNDDIKVSLFFKYFLFRSEIFKDEIALINRSWSHFMISKSIIKKNGWFDERFPAVGNEDEDYESRLVANNINLKSYVINGIKNEIYLTKNFSYGSNIESINNKYVKANKIFFDKKWKTSADYFPGSFFVQILNRYVKLNEDMETPNFYESNNF